MIRNQSELKAMTTEMEDVRIANFILSGQKSLDMKKQQSMKNLTIGVNALSSISVLELSGLELLERVIIMRGGVYGGSGRLRVVNCSNLHIIDIGEFAFTKYKYLELLNLPMLQTVKFDNSTFSSIQTILFEGNC